VKERVRGNGQIELNSLSSANMESLRNYMHSPYETLNIQTFRLLWDIYDLVMNDSAIVIVRNLT
jgi:hypothetical protein